MAELLVAWWSNRAPLTYRDARPSSYRSLPIQYSGSGLSHTRRRNPPHQVR
jgi:hypothetical protein